MAKLTSALRSKVPSSDFGLPKSRKYPMPDRSHAINAKARATQQAARGNLTPAQHAAIMSKANSKLRSKA